MNTLKTFPRPLNYAKALSIIIPRNNGTREGLEALKRTIARGNKLIKECTPLLLPAIFCTAAIASMVFGLTIIAFTYLT